MEAVTKNPYVAASKYLEFVLSYTHCPGEPELTCIHCGEKFHSGKDPKTGKNGHALYRMRVHLRSCDKRRLLRVAKLGTKLLVVIVLRPSFKTQGALTKMCDEGEVTKEQAIEYVGALKYNMHRGKIFKYFIYEVKNSPNLIDIRNGIFGVTKIIKKLSKDDLKSFVEFCERIYERRQLPYDKDEEFI